MAVGRGFGKIILFGEHAAVYGHPAVGLRLPLYLNVRFTPGDDWSIPDLSDDAQTMIRKALALLPKVLHNFGVEDPGRGTLEFGGNLPMSVGLGSSAAFCTALLQAVAPPLSGRELWEAAHRLEHAFHGSPSGIDTGLSLHDGCSLLLPQPPELPERKPVELPDGWIVAGAVPRTKSTGELVAGIRAKRSREPRNVDRALRNLGLLSSQAASLGRSGRIGRMGELADEAQRTLESIGLSVPPVAEALELLRSCGSAGGKISGGGGGGAFFAVFSDELAATRARQRLLTWLDTHYRLPAGPFAVMIGL